MATAVDEEAEEEESIYLTAMATLCFCCILCRIKSREEQTIKSEKHIK